MIGLAVENAVPFTIDPRPRRCVKRNDSCEMIRTMTEAWRNPDVAPAEIRQSWLTAVAREFQLADAIPRDIDVARHRGALLATANAIPRPDSVAEQLLLRGLSAEFVYRVGPTFHDAVHAPTSDRCGFAPHAYVGVIFAAADRDPIGGLTTWIRRFFDDLELRHAPSPADVMAAALRTRYECAWTNDTLGRLVDSPGARAARVFHRRFGLAPKDYLALIRVQHALGMVREHKVEWVAARVGYRSKKDFYRVFVQFTGMTPRQFRSLAPQDATGVIDQIAIRLHRASMCPARSFR
jgi:AraC-like DNA-binding protein